MSVNPVMCQKPEYPMRNLTVTLTTLLVCLAGFLANARTAESQTERPAGFERPIRRAPPPVSTTDWLRNPVDAFILAKLDGQSLRPAPTTSLRVLARRLHFDLVGLPPTPAELQQFLDNPAPDAYPQLVDRLLADPRYAERWARHWLDVAGFAETDGLEDDIIIGNLWRYRDWVIDALDCDMPYDQFVTMQIAGGDEVHPTKAWHQPDVQDYIPAGFLRLAPWDLG